MIYLEIYLIGFLIVIVGTKVINYYFSKNSLDYVPFMMAFLTALLSWVFILVWTLAFVIMPIFEWTGSNLYKLGQSIKKDFEKLAITSLA